MILFNYTDQGTMITVQLVLQTGFVLNGLFVSVLHGKENFWLKTFDVYPHSCSMLIGSFLTKGESVNKAGNFGVLKIKEIIYIFFLL